MKFKLNLHICGIHLLNPYKTVVSHLEDLMKDVVCREFIVKDFEKCSSNVGGYVSAERGIIPNDDAGTILSGI